MRRYKTEKREVERRVLADVRCDLCGAQAKQPWNEWGVGCYEVNEVEVRVEVRAKDGDNYPDGGSGTEYMVDLCPTCFRDRLIPWLCEQGAQIEAMKWDW